MTELRMSIDDLEGERKVYLPSGYSERFYSPGDELNWLQIQRLTGLYEPVSENLFQSEFGTELESLPERQIFVINFEGNPIGTGTAWFPESEYDSSWGRIHWIAVVPEHQRLGIGTVLTQRVCKILSILNCSHAYLTTGITNIRAVLLYLSLGPSVPIYMRQ